MDLALNNLQRLICRKTQQTNQLACCRRFRTSRQNHKYLIIHLGRVHMQIRYFIADSINDLVGVAVDVRMCTDIRNILGQQLYAWINNTGAFKKK